MGGQPGEKQQAAPTKDDPMSGISVLILTKNEQLDLAGCLESLSWSDDIHVYDSMSTDRTVDIAKAFGATVTQRPFDNWSSHQNWGLRNIPFKHKWVYYSDADERVTPELAQALKAFALDPGEHVALRVRRRDYLMGTWLKRVTPSPFNIRFFKPAHIKYERLTNPVTLVDGPIADTDKHFDHYPFSKGMAHWFSKHNSYSTSEADQILTNRRAGANFSAWTALFSKDSNERRFHQKELYYRLPMRPFAMFLLLYVGKRGFLDGHAGLTFAILRSIYEYMIVLKVKEQEQQVPQAATSATLSQP
ncbi:MAG: glycosyltransferase family 2 protein [Hydrogenophaga sp.]|nr:glycosyltransferase family 2 protein [Hydrogenophaga sp.]